MKERRKYQRVTIKSVAEVTVVATNVRQQTFVGGVSRGGLEMYCQQPFPVKQEVTIHMTFLTPKGEESSEELRGTIRWSSKLGEGYLAGVEFSTPINDQGHPALCSYIANVVPNT